MTGPFRVRKAEGGRLFCGPTAVAAVTGVHADDVVDKIVELRRQNNSTKRPRKARVTGLSNSELVDTVRELGFKIKQVPKWEGRLSLRKFVTGVSSKSTGRRFILEVPMHYVAVDGALVIDGSTPVGGQWFMDHECKNWRVNRAWEVF